MPDPTVTRVPTPPGSVIVVRNPDPPAPAEEQFAAATELHRQTGLPVVVVTGEGDLWASLPEDAERALVSVLTATVTVMPAPDLARDLLDALRAEGWALIRLRHP